MDGILEEIDGTHTRLELPSLRVDALDEAVYGLLGRENRARSPSRRRPAASVCAT